MPFELVATLCALAEAATTLDGQLAYRRDRTPAVTSIQPRQGSTAGGTVLTLAAAGLPAGLRSDEVDVDVVGLPCVVQSVQTSSVTCTTSSYGVTSSDKPGVGPVSLTIKSMGTAVTTSNATYEYVDLWSRRTTWGGEANTIPGLETTGDSIWIQVGQRIDRKSVGRERV